MSDSSGSTPPLLATWEQAYVFGAGSLNLDSFSDEDSQTDLMAEATASIEDQCDRRLAPFTGLTHSERAWGVDQGILAGNDVPLDLAGAIGRSQALAFASTRMVRDIWLPEYAPRRPENWVYDVTQIQLVRAYGDTEIVDPSSIEGPEPDSGHLRFRLGTFVPEGTTIRVTYGGGYSPVPWALQQATVLRALKMAILGAQPETRDKLSFSELDAEILSLIAPYIR